MTRVKTSNSGRRYVEIDEVVKEEMARIKKKSTQGAIMTNEVPKRIWISRNSLQDNDNFVRLLSDDVEFIRSDVALEQAVEIVKAKRDELSPVGFGAKICNEIIAALEAAKEG